MEKLLVKTIKDNIATVSGEHAYQFLEVINFKNETQGFVLKASINSAEVALLNLNENQPLGVGDEAIPTGELFKANIYDNLLGSVLDVSLNELITFTKRDPEVIRQMRVFEEAKPIYTREAVNQPLETGITAIDGILPIGRGQKQLIFGDRGTGKTAIVMNAMLAQEEKAVLNIYVGIGKKREEIVEIFSVLKRRNVMHKTIIVSAAADDTAAAKYLAPYVGMAIAEYFQELNRDVLIVFDDLSNHADAYRELALLSGSAPGREAYPGDIFYTHSRLLERAGRYKALYGGGSITALPIVQTLEGDVSAYIPTNLVSITDGQIYTSTHLFNTGKRPAIDIGLSVSRIGSAAQEPVMVEAVRGLRRLITEYERQKNLQAFSANLDEASLEKFELGRMFYILTNQAEYEVVDYHTTSILFFLLKRGYLSFYDDQDDNFVLLKDVLKVFLNKDVLGKKFRDLLRSHDLDEPVIELYLTRLILPLLKYHLLTNSSYLAKNENFIRQFKDIRNDGRVLLAYERRGLEKGIAYEYN